MADPSPTNHPKTARLRAAPEFQAVFKNGLKRSGVFFRLYFLATPNAAPRLGMAVPKKMAPLAVSRNRIKRVCRETFRQRRHILAAGDFVLVAQAQAKTATPRALRAELELLLSRVCARTAE
jgi:ribonuclease P protein component